MKKKRKRKTRRVEKEVKKGLVSRVVEEMRSKTNPLQETENLREERRHPPSPRGKTWAVTSKGGGKESKQLC